MIEATQKTCYIFNCSARGLSFNFQVFDESGDVARQKLIDALREMATELSQYKAGAKAN